MDTRANLPTENKFGVGMGECMFTGHAIMEGTKKSYAPVAVHVRGLRGVLVGIKLSSQRERGQKENVGCRHRAFKVYCLPCR
jgi:hypothetical protein